jgi:hypothetical protein
VCDRNFHEIIPKFYLSYACQSKDYLKGWEVVQKVTPHGKLPVPNNEDELDKSKHI